MSIGLRGDEEVDHANTQRLSDTCKRMKGHVPRAGLDALDVVERGAQRGCQVALRPRPRAAELRDSSTDVMNEPCGIFLHVPTVGGITRSEYFL